jgi:hypothetical protein
MRRVAVGVVIVAAAAAAAAASCGDSAPAPHVLLDFTRATSLYDAPVPADDLLVGSGVDVSRMPNPDGVSSVEQIRALLADNDGFATTGGVFFPISDALDPSTLPSLADSATAASTAFLIGIDPTAPDYKVRYPLEVSFEGSASLYGAPNLLALLPLQGMPMRPSTRYAAVATTGLHTVSGEPLASAPAAALARFPDAVAALDAAGVDRAQIAGLTAFTTGDPAATLAKVRAAALALPLPVIDAPFTQTEVFDDYCVYHTTIAMPDFQSGTPPFTAAGGNWTFDGSGQPILQRMDESNLVVTIPRAPAPSAGYPLVVFVRTGAGGDRPLVDRGQQAMTGGPPIIPGEGPALYFARAGFAGIEVDGPLGGLRNTTDANEDYTVFNVANLPAMRDNIRESAVELDVIAHVGVALQLDTNDCIGAGPTSTFDASHVAIMGHSMGSWIEPLAVAFEPMFRAVLMSGAGGSWIENIMYKQEPTPVYGLISTFFHEPDLRADDPIMTFTQWSLEAADPQIYGPAIIRDPAAGASPRHVLMMQGIVDDYILPRIANATSLSFGLDLAGVEHDTEDDPRLAGELPIGPLLPLDGRKMIALPAMANVAIGGGGGGGSVTAVLTQHPEDGIEDGHEVVFQTDPPKHEYQCFLASWLATGTPYVATDAPRDALCP